MNDIFTLILPVDRMTKIASTEIPAAVCYEWPNFLVSFCLRCSLYEHHPPPMSISCLNQLIVSSC